MIKAGLVRSCYAFVLSGIFLILNTESAYAIAQADVVLENMVESAESLPGLVTSFAYLLGLVLGVSGVLKIKEHVEKPEQVPIRTPVIRLLVGGGMFALPIIYEAMETAINNGTVLSFDPGSTAGGIIQGLFSWLSWSFLPNVNGVLAGIVNQIEGAPAFVAALGYLLGLVFGVAGMLKLKEHVENPDQVKMKEPVIRFLAGGAFFAFPTLLQAMHNLVVDPGLLGDIMGAIGSLQMITSEWDITAYFGTGVIGCAAWGLFNPSVGTSMCNVILSAGAIPAFLSALSYLIGIILAFWAILKIKDHVENPQQTPVWEGFSRLIAGGFFLAMPFLVEVLRVTVTPVSLPAARVVQAATTSFNENITGCNGLDGALGCMMDDILMPLHTVLNLFTLSAGMILIMIGISRLTKSAQEGARGPSGIGTFMTFLIGGMLLSYNEMLFAFTSSFFINPLTATFATLQYTTGMTAQELEHAHTIISAVVKFMILVGLVSFIRGLFIIRSVAEGNGQASLMAGMTHLIGGALAVNLGPLIEVVQATLGITGFGIGFT